MAKYFYNDDMDTIQSIRLFHALSEAGVELSITEDNKAKLEYLNSYFTIPYSIKSEEKDLPNLKIFHEELPGCSFFDKKLSLVYPKEVFYYLKNRRPAKRYNKLFFQGTITEKRKKEIEKIEKTSVLKVKSFSSDSGIVCPIKCWDSSYYSTMAKFKFVFCPDGDFIWTYRFFEAIMCGCIPVIQNTCPLYEGFKYFTENDLHNLSYDEEIVKHNDLLFLKKYTLSYYEKN